MKGNISTLTMTTADPVQVHHSTKKTNTSNISANRDVFLTYLQPVKKHLYNFIRKTLNFSADADDIFQDTLLKGFCYFHSFDRRKNFKPWLFTIAHNLIKDVLRQKGHPHNPIPLGDEREIKLEANHTAISTQVREIYAEAAKLKPRQREVFFLYYYNEFNIGEITQITGLTRVNIKFILHQARSAIKKVLEVQR